MPRSFTARLKAAQANGARIVCSVAPYEGWTVVHLARHDRDPQPWILATDRAAAYAMRFSGRECHAVAPDQEP